MWDLDSIVRQNNQAAISYMMAGQTLGDAQAPQPEAWSLSVLAEKLRIGPPLLEELLQGFLDIDTVKSFLELVRTYLPEHEEDITSQPRSQRVYRFCYLFGKRYYPLPVWSHNASMKEFVSGMPVELMAMSHSAYHELDMRPGYLMLMSLVIYPYEGDERDAEDDDVPFDPFDPMKRYNMEAKLGQIANAKETKSKWRPKASDITWVKNLLAQLDYGGKWFAPMGFTFIKVDDRNIELRQAENTPEVRETVHRTALICEKVGLKVKVVVGKTAEEKQGATLMEVFNGARVPLIDAVQKLVGKDLANRIPPKGWTAEELHKLTDGTPHDGVAAFGDWACSETGCVVLDSAHDNCEYIEGMGEPLFRWTKRNVEILTQDWSKLKEIRSKIDQLVEWLEADPRGRFGQLLEFLLAGAKKKLKGQPKKKGKYGIKSERYEYDFTEHLCILDQQYNYDEEEEDGENDDGAGEENGGVQVTEITPEDFVAGRAL